MKTIGAIPTEHPIPVAPRPGAANERPRAPQHEFLVASFFAQTTADVEFSFVPRWLEARARSLRRKFLTGDFP